jgi:hypothetical protein
VKTYAELHGNMQRCRIKSLHGNKLEYFSKDIKNQLAAVTNMFEDVVKPLRDLDIARRGYTLPNTDFDIGAGGHLPRCRVICR